MKSNHVGKRIAAIITLIFGLVLLPITILTAVLAFMPDVTAQIMAMLEEYAASIGASTNSSEVSYPPESAIAMIVIDGLLLLVSIIFFRLSSLKARVKMNDYYNLRREGVLRFRFAVPFIIIGAVALFSVAFVYKYAPIIVFYIVLGVGCFFFVVGMFSLIPVPANFGVKRQYIGKKVIITYPRNKLMKGFNPNQIICEMSAANASGYNHVDSIKVNELGTGLVQLKITLSSTELSPRELARKRQDHFDYALKTLKHKQTLVPNFDYEVETIEGKTFSTVRDLKTSVNDYDVITHYSDGTTSRSSHYKDVKTGELITFKKNIYYRYDYFFLPPDTKEKIYVGDESGQPLAFILYGGTKIVGTEKHGSGD